jgi:hypothetical protein
VQLDEASREREPEARALTLLDADARLLELLERPLVVLAGEMSGPPVGSRKPEIAQPSAPLPLSSQLRTRRSVRGAPTDKPRLDCVDETFAKRNSLLRLLRLDRFVERDECP